MDIQSLIKDWQDFYKEVFGIEVDFSQLHIPKHQEGFDRLIVVAQGMTPRKLYDKCSEMFPCWKGIDGDLDKVITSGRTAKNGPYAVWVRDCQEADEELKNLSANKLKQMKIPAITFEERLLFELKFFKETGKHLDLENWTLCAGSRYGDGHVPSVIWSSYYLGGLLVDQYFSHSYYDSRRARKAVS